jgi:hypothetical protein
MIQESGTTAARATGAGDAEAIALGIISAKTKRVRVEKTTAARTPYFWPSHFSATVVAEAEAALRNRFWPMRMTASSRGVFERRLRISAPRRSPFSRIACRSMRPSETSAVSEPAKNAEKASERTKAMT